MRTGRNQTHYYVLVLEGGEGTDVVKGNRKNREEKVQGSKQQMEGRGRVLWRKINKRVREEKRK